MCFVSLKNESSTKKWLCQRQVKDTQWSETQWRINRGKWGIDFIFYFTHFIFDNTIEIQSKLIKVNTLF